MDRRTYLSLAATAGTGALAGCGAFAGGSGGDEDAYLATPDRQVDPGDLPYPAYGQQLPDVTLPAPLHGETVSLREFDTDVFLTFFYTNCESTCPRHVSALRAIQAEAAADGYDDAVTFVAINFDPGRDTPEQIQAYADRMNVDTDAGNWYFLRPESAEQVETVVNGQFGLAVQRTTPEGMDRYMFAHAGILVLANRDTYVERTWTDTQPVWQDLYGQFTTLREREG